MQLLETGLLHADPHPGNLLRTADGKICILDFGLMTEVAPERRIALVEYIAHLSVQDWNGVAKDLVNLGFTPEGTPLVPHIGGGTLQWAGVTPGAALSLSLQESRQSLNGSSSKFAELVERGRAVPDTITMHALETQSCTSATIKY